MSRKKVIRLKAVRLKGRRSSKFLVAGSKREEKE